MFLCVFCVSFVWCLEHQPVVGFWSFKTVLHETKPGYGPLAGFDSLDIDPGRLLLLVHANAKGPRYIDAKSCFRTYVDHT